MQTIITKYLGPTDRRGSRVKATASGGAAVTLSWDYALDSGENHKAAALALMSKLDWTGAMQGGDLKSGMAFCFLSAQDQITRKEGK